MAAISRKECAMYATSEEYMDFIFNNNTSYYDINTLGCTQVVDENWSVGYGNLPKGLTMSVTDLNYHIIPKLYATVDLSSFESSGISSVLEQPLLDVKGRGVIAGIIDTGIDYTYDIFKKSPIESRIGILWDQTATNTYSEDNGKENKIDVLFGNVYYQQDINRALAVMEEGGDYNNIADSHDESLHGTYVAGVVAAAAPEAELAVVKLKPAKQYLRKYFFIADDQQVYEENDLMLGVRFLLEYARLQGKPLVILVSLATGSGPRTGATPLANVLALAAARTNVAVVTAVGNEADNRTHVSAVAVSDSSPYVCELNVGPDEEGIVIELWAGTMDILSVGFVSPSGETVARIPAKENVIEAHDFIFEKTRITVEYQVVEELSGFELVFIRMIKPAQGVWRINVYSLTTILGKFNMWLNMKKLMSSDTYFLNSNPDTTLLEPSSDERVISVGSYNHRTGSADIDSGRGYNAKGAVKPDVVAPGVNVIWPPYDNRMNSNSVNVHGAMRVMSGTSVAAAHVAGMAALLLQWGVTDGNNRLMGNNQIKSILTRGAVRNVNIEQEGKGYPDPVSGYGKVNIMDSFLQLRIN